MTQAQPTSFPSTELASSGAIAFHQPPLSYQPSPPFTDPSQAAACDGYEPGAAAPPPKYSILPPTANMYAPPPANMYAPPPGNMYPPPPANMYPPPPGNMYAPPPGNMYAPPPGNMYAPPQPYMQSNQNMQTNIVVVGAQQPIVVTQPTGMLTPSYIGWSVFNFLCCFWPLGLAAIIFSVKVSTARSTQEAKRYSMTAKNLNIAATVLMPVLVAIIVGSYMGAAVSAVTYSGNASPSAYYYAYSASYSALTTYSYYTYYSYYNSFYGATTYNFNVNYGYQYATAYRYTLGSYYYG